MLRALGYKHANSALQFVNWSLHLSTIRKLTLQNCRQFHILPYLGSLRIQTRNPYIASTVRILFGDWSTPGIKIEFMITSDKIKHVSLSCLPIFSEKNNVSKRGHRAQSLCVRTNYLWRCEHITMTSRERHGKTIGKLTVVDLNKLLKNKETPNSVIHSCSSPIRSFANPPLTLRHGQLINCIQHKIIECIFPYLYSEYVTNFTREIVFKGTDGKPALLQVMCWRPNKWQASSWNSLDSQVHGTNMGPTWVLSAPDGPHVGVLPL